LTLKKQMAKKQRSQDVDSHDLSFVYNSFFQRLLQIKNGLKPKSQPVCILLQIA
jgi:hypothetical protein